MAMVTLATFQPSTLVPDVVQILKLELVISEKVLKVFRRIESQLFAFASDHFLLHLTPRPFIQA